MRAFRTGVPPAGQPRERGASACAAYSAAPPQLGWIADDHHFHWELLLPGKEVRGDDLRAREPAARYGHARTHRVGCLDDGQCCCVCREAKVECWRPPR